MGREIPKETEPEEEEDDEADGGAELRMRLQGCAPLKQPHLPHMSALNSSDGRARGRFCSGWAWTTMMTTMRTPTTTSMIGTTGKAAGWILRRTACSVRRWDHARLHLRCAARLSGRNRRPHHQTQSPLHALIRFGSIAGKVLEAAEAGDADLLASLLPTLTVGLETLGPEGDTPLHLAALYGASRVRRRAGTHLLRCCYAAPRGRCGHERASVSIHAPSACTDARPPTGHENCVDELLKAGANAGACDDAGGTPLVRWASSHRRPSPGIVLSPRCLTRSPWDSPAQHDASAGGYISIVRKLIAAAPASLNEVDSDGDTPLVRHPLSLITCAPVLPRCRRCWRRRPLIATSASPPAWPRHHAQHCAARGGHLDCVRVLLDAGADADARNFSEQTPLMLVDAGNQALRVLFGDGE